MCQCEWLLVSSSAPGTSLGSSGSPEKFLFCTGRIVATVLPNLVPPRHIDDCFAIHFLHWEFCDPPWSSHQNVPLWARLYQYVFCKTPLLFSSSGRYHNLGPSESACFHCAYPNLVPLLLATPWVFHEMTWKCLNFLALGSSKALLKYFHRPNSLWIAVANRAIHVIYRSVLLRVPPFFLFFVSVHSCSGFPRSSSLILPLLSDTGFSVYLLTTNTESCDDEVGEGVVEEELADKPGTTNGT